MEEDLAIEIYEYAQENIITDTSDLLDLESVDEQMLNVWDSHLEDMRFDINKADEKSLKSIKGVGTKLANIILKAKKQLGEFKVIDELKEIEGIGKSKFNELKSRLKIGE
jgi:competence ComEA-like helix-hairpin-helix protein